MGISLQDPFTESRSKEFTHFSHFISYILVLYWCCVKNILFTTGMCKFPPHIWINRILGSYAALILGPAGGWLTLLICFSPLPNLFWFPLIPTQSSLVVFICLLSSFCYYVISSDQGQSGPVMVRHQKNKSSNPNHSSLLCPHAAIDSSSTTMLM